MSAQPDHVPHSVATYVYAVCKDLAASVLGTLRGVDAKSQVRALPFGHLTAVVQHVRAAEFTEEAWHERLQDEGELERCARAHHQVVSTAAAFGPTVPLALATLYHDDERARSSLLNDIERFQRALRRVEGHVEWGVKVYAPPGGGPATGTSPVAGGEDVEPGPGAGRAYLERKRGLHRQREQRHNDALRMADTVDAALRELAAVGRRLRAQDHTMPEARGVQVLNAAYLVGTDRTDAFAQAVHSLRHRTGAAIETTGPWVPYSFAGEV